MMMLLNCKDWVAGPANPNYVPEEAASWKPGDVILVRPHNNGCPYAWVVCQVRQDGKRLAHFYGELEPREVYAWVSFPFQALARAVVDISTPNSRATYLRNSRLWFRKNNVEHGTLVRVTREAQSGEGGWDNSWAPEMNSSVGKVLSIDSTEDSLDISHGIQLSDGFGYPWFVLEVFGEKEVEIVM
jgi:hypothetical protein